MAKRTVEGPYCVRITILDTGSKEYEVMEEIDGAQNKYEELRPRYIRKIRQLAYRRAGSLNRRWQKEHSS